MIMICKYYIKPRQCVQYNVSCWPQWKARPQLHLHVRWNTCS